MKFKIKGIITALLVLVISSCKVPDSDTTFTSIPTTIPPTIQITIKPSITTSPTPTKTITPVPTETIVTCPSTPKILSLENGLTWTEVVIPNRRYYYVKPDVALLKSCIDFPNSNDHDQEIYGERVHNDPISDLSLEIGDGIYETKFDSTLGCCDYDLLKNGVVIYHTHAPFIATDPNRGFWNIGGKLVWELLADPPVIIVDGVNFNDEYQLEGSYYPYDINGKLIYIAKKSETYQIFYNNEEIGPEFDNISRAYCCAGMSVMRGGGQYWFIGKRDGANYIILIQ